MTAATLAKRLAQLEAKAPRLEPEQVKTDYAALQARLRESFDKVLKPDPTGAAGIRHYRKLIIETRLKAQQTPPPDPDTQFLTNWEAFGIMVARKDVERNHGDTRHALRACELEVLTNEGFDPARIAAWRHEHERYKEIPWQWRGADLPDDALAVIEAALAREKTEAIQQ